MMRRLLLIIPAVAASTTISDCDVKHASAATLVSATRRRRLRVRGDASVAVDATDLAVNEALLELRSAEQRLKDVRDALRTSEASSVEEAWRPRTSGRSPATSCLCL